MYLFRRINIWLMRMTPYVQKLPPCVPRTRASIKKLPPWVSRTDASRKNLPPPKKNSRNSSKPPSSNLVKPTPKGKKQKRTSGGQPGRPANFRKPFPPEQLDEVNVFDPPSLTRTCGGALTPHPLSDQVQQQIDLREDPILRREYRARAYYCSSCGTFHRGLLPDNVLRQGFIGERLAATLAFLNVRAHASYSALVAFMTAVCGEYLSRGQIAKTLRLVAKSLEAPYNEVLEQLRQEPVLNIDETGHREKGKRFWTGYSGPPALPYSISTRPARHRS